MMSNQLKRMEEYVQQEFGVSTEFLWDRYPTYGVFRNPRTDKWFALHVTVDGYKIGRPEVCTADLLVVRCGAALTGSLLQQPGYTAARYMSKASWVSVILDDVVEDDELRKLLLLSYNSVS